MLFLEIEPFASKDRPEHDCKLAEIAYSGECRRVHKWTHYFKIYERHLGKFRGTAFKMLEIGVNGAGSLDMWRRYFGPGATIFGIDINPDCAMLDAPETPVRIGSQADADFLKRVVEEMGGLDVVLDDGSHRAKHQRASFYALFPLLSEGGLYIIEDAHTSYWLRFGGGKPASRQLQWIPAIAIDSDDMLAGTIAVGRLPKHNIRSEASRSMTQ